MFEKCLFPKGQPLFYLVSLFDAISQCKYSELYSIIGIVFVFLHYAKQQSERQNQKRDRNMHIFDEYLNDRDLEKRERAKLWRTSIGLQAVDNLRVSSFLIETARKHIEGDISMDEVSRSIDKHYKKKRR